MPVEPRTFGLVAGLGVGAGIFYYKTLVDAHIALGLSARLVMVHATFAEYWLMSRHKRQMRWLSI